MQTIGQLLNTQIREKQQLIEHLNAVILPLLPEQCRKHVTASNLNQYELTLIADSPVWAARLRTQHKLICTQVNKQLNLSVQKIKIRFNQPKCDRKPESSTPRSPKMSQSASDLLKKTADSITDEGLKTALQRLASRVNQ